MCFFFLNQFEVNTIQFKGLDIFLSEKVIFLAKTLLFSTEKNHSFKLISFFRALFLKEILQ